MSDFAVLKPDWRFIVSFALGGIALAVALYSVALGRPDAVVVFQAGRIGGIENIQTRVTPSLVLDRRGVPQVLFERIQTRPFARQIADELGRPELADELPASQYGGRAKLRVRGIGDGSLAEIRVKAATPDLALKIADLAAKNAVAADIETNAALLTLMKKRIAELGAERAATLRIADALTEAAGKADNTHVLMTAFDARNRVQTMTDTLWALETGLVPPMAQNAEVFSAATLTSPVIKSWWAAALLGMIAGGALGYPAGLMWRRARAGSEPTSPGEMRPPATRHTASVTSAA
jgi:hypothetical protein